MDYSEFRFKLFLLTSIGMILEFSSTNPSGAVNVDFS